MALHRDIFWVGRQWAVTGYGIQAVDQKHKAHFDIEAGRVWQDGLAESLQADGWFNKEDFGNALFVARARYPEPSGNSPPPEPPQVTAGLEASAAVEPLMESPSPVEPPRFELPGPVEPPRPAIQTFDMQVVGWPAKFVRPWHVRVRL
jgi:hypothetical protein